LSPIFLADIQISIASDSLKSEYFLILLTGHKITCPGLKGLKYNVMKLIISFIRISYLLKNAKYINSFKIQIFCFRILESFWISRFN